MRLTSTTFVSVSGALARIARNPSRRASKVSGLSSLVSEQIAAVVQPAIISSTSSNLHRVTSFRSIQTGSDPPRDATRSSSSFAGPLPPVKPHTAMRPTASNTAGPLEGVTLDALAAGALERSPSTFPASLASCSSTSSAIPSSSASSSASSAAKAASASASSSSPAEAQRATSGLGRPWNDELQPLQCKAEAAAAPKRAARRANEVCRSRR
mmetsp:Transcript_2684/g.6809  ORF Transcript_2684/g.6809 Transcript_2684/m.6809 type:complete len:212 (+) Transcript_2684:778-1413(+)